VFYDFNINLLRLKISFASIYSAEISTVVIHSANGVLTQNLALVASLFARLSQETYFGLCKLPAKAISLLLPDYII
jgi:hypothetical protein